MQVEVVRRGGFAGVSLRGSVDTSELPPRTADQAEAALQALPFGRPATVPRHPDSFQYEITLAHGDARRSAILDEAELPEDLRPVVEAAIERGQLD